MESMELVYIKTLGGYSSLISALSSSLGNSKDILCVWDPTLFVKENITSSDNFLAVMGANAFNSFISLASLIDLPLDGYAYTWAYKTANKMKLNDINYIGSLEAAQKSKVRWAIEGDENTKFFYGILNSKRSKLAIRGTIFYGEWIVDQLAVKKNVNPPSSTSNREFLDPKKKKEIESWLGDSRIIDSLDKSNEIEYFDFQSPNVVMTKDLETDDID
ncbi:hypothetical protein Tco_0339097 [Tanacetum coccineum]